MSENIGQTQTVPKPWVPPSEHSRFYWEAARQHQLKIQRCNSCSTYIHPPMPVCAKCHSRQLHPEQVSGKGVVYSFTVVRHLFHPGFADVMPYILALIELREQANLRVLTHIVECRPEDAHVGMEVEVVFEDRGEHTVPQFRPVSSATFTGQKGART